jgi:hypothetical protein
VNQLRAAKDAQGQADRFFAFPKIDAALRRLLELTHREFKKPKEAPLPRRRPQYLDRL